MPFLDEFASSFTNAFGTVSEVAGRRRALEEQRRQFDVSSGYERERVDIEKAQEERAAEEAEYQRSQRAAAEAATAATTEESIQRAALLKEQAIRAKWENDPERQALELEETRANIEKLQADGKLTNAQADDIIAQLPYAGAKIKAYIDNINAQTDSLKQETIAKQMNNELLYGGTLTPARKLYQDYIEKYGLPPPMEGFEGGVGGGAIPTGEDIEEPNPVLSAPLSPTVVEPTVTVGGQPFSPRPEYTEAAQPPTPLTAIPSIAGAARGLTAGPSQRPGEIPYTAATRAQAPYGRTETPPPPARANEPFGPVNAPARRPPYPQEPLSNTYRAEPISYRPGEGRVIEAQAGTRRLPLNDRTRSMLEQASAATGLDVRVTSGAQPSSGPNRTGSHRHDQEVGAADLQLLDKATGKPVNMSTPEGQQQIIAFMRAARDAGATGFGAGTDYMGNETIHVGFGDPGVWGAGGKSANAPKWLVAGLSGGEGGRPSAIPTETSARPAGVTRVYQGLQQRDMPQMQAAVLAGNIQQESSGDPNSVNTREGAEGIIQWRQDRLDKLKAFANEEERDYRDLDTQLDFIVAEGEERGSEQDKAAWTEFMSATTPEAANAALKKFIRYGDNSQGTRLQYAENLLTGGGGEIRGERGVTQELGRRERMPTPRGEVAQNVRRQTIVNTSLQASKEALKAIYANAPRQGAMPTQQSQAELRSIVLNEGAATPQEMARAKEAVQRTATEPMSQAELNLATLAYAYDWALMVDKDPEKAQGIAKSILQSYNRTVNQYMSFAKTQAENGQLDQAAQIAAKAYAFIPDGKEATVTKNDDGTFTVTSKDMATGKLVQQQILTPDQMYSSIMGWNGTVDFHRQLMKAAGEQVASEAFAVQSTQLAQGIPVSPPGTPAGTVPTTQANIVAEMQGRAPSAGGEPPPVPNIAAMTKEEIEPALAQTRLAQDQYTQRRKEIFGEPFSASARDALYEDISAAVAADPAPMEALKAAFPGREAKVEELIFAVQQMNPNNSVQTIISDLASMVQGTADQPTFNIVGQTRETRSVQPITGGILNMPTQTFNTIWNALLQKSVSAVAPPSTAVRDAGTAAERAAAEAAAPRAIPAPINPRTGQPFPPTGRGRAGQPLYSPFAPTNVPGAEAAQGARSAIPQPPPRRYSGTGLRTGR